MTYTAFDRFVAWCRFSAVLPHILTDSRVCDLVCAAGAPFLHFVQRRIRWGVGLDHLPGPANGSRWPLVRAEIASSLPLRSEQFDHVVMLAVLEHLLHPEPVLRECFRLLAPGGSLILTWPSSLVDPILSVLTRIGFVGR